jgi:hypothetical protein
MLPVDKLPTLLYYACATEKFKDFLNMKPAFDLGSAKSP